MFLTLLCPVAVWSQVTISGKVIDQNNEALPYVNIGIVNTYIGTISEVDGSFRIVIPENFRNRQITFSMVGYKRQSIDISELSDTDSTVVLEEDVINLDEVVISGTRQKLSIEKLGTRKWNAHRFMTDSIYAGAAISKKIEFPEEFGVIQYVRIGYKNSIQGLKMRFTFYASQNNRPARLLQSQQIISELKVQDGFHKVDLSVYQIMVEGDFFLILEPIITGEHRKKFKKQVDQIIAERPELIGNSGPEIMITDFGDLKMDFMMFKVLRGEPSMSLYRTSSFDSWKPSEALAVEVGLGVYR